MKKIDTNFGIGTSEWAARRSKPSPERIARALKVLDRPTHTPPSSGDELPEDYRSIRNSAEYKKVLAKR